MINMWNQDLSLGIDISDRHISAVLLARRRDKITVVKTATQSLAASAFTAGGIKTAQTIGRTIRQLLSRAGIRQKRAWVSFGSQGLLLQMVDMPEQLPSNIGQYIRRQIRNSTLLNSKNPCLDFAAVTKNEAAETGRCLVAAIDSQKIEVLTKSLSAASVYPQAIDIPIMALCRALYKKQISHGYKFHTLLFYVHGQNVYLAVLHKASLDYVRLAWIDQDRQTDFETWSVNQIRNVIQYYEVEHLVRGDEELMWQFVLASDNQSILLEKLKAEVEKSFHGAIVCLNGENASTWLPVAIDSKIKNLPFGATGAALRKWADSGLKTEIDLLPEQNRKIRAVADYFINTSRIAAAVLFVIMVFAYGLNSHVNKMSRLHSVGQTAPAEDIEQLLAEKQKLTEQLTLMKQQKEEVNAMIGGLSVENLVSLMNQIRQSTPTGVRMTQFWSSSKGIIEIDGYCPTMEDIQNYASRLEMADYIKAAQVRQSGTYSKNSNWRSFTIICTLREGI